MKRLLKQSDAGRLCLVEYDDIGRVEGMITDICDNRRTAGVFIFMDRKMDSVVDKDQIVEINDYAMPNGILKSQGVRR
jgi:hypothetical protein